MKRLRLTFSLKTVLIFITVVAVFLATGVHRAVQQRRGVKRLRKLGYQVYYDYHDEGKAFSHRRNPRIPLFLEKHVGIDFFHSVAYVKAPKAIASFGSEAADLKAMKGLKRLVLQGCADLSNLKLPQLEYLQVKGTVNDASSLRHMKNLKEVDLEWTKIADLTALENLSKLESLKVGRVESLQPIAKLCRLKHLTCHHVPQLDGLEELSELTFLDVDECDRPDLMMVSNARSLQFLTIKGGGVADLLPLKRLSKLTNVVLYCQDNQIALSPLAQHRSLTELHLIGGRYRTVESLANCPLDKLQFTCAEVDLSAASKLVKLKQCEFMECRTEGLEAIATLPNLSVTFSLPVNANEVDSLKTEIEKLGSSALSPAVSVLSGEFYDGLEESGW